MVALITALIAVLVLELYGVVQAKRRRLDTISELYWWLLDHTSRPTRWALNVALVAVLAWTAVHLTCNCGI
jgi:hypothetical protein